MPWSKNEAKRHTKLASGERAATWARVANRVLKESGDEGKAVRIANAVVRKQAIAAGMKALSRR